MTVLFRPLAASAVYLRSFARRLGNALLRRGSGGAANAVQDGYLLRATCKGATATVIALDPQAVWLLLYWNNYGAGDNWPILSGVRHLTRDPLTPDAAGDPPEARAVSADNALGVALHGSALTGAVTGSLYYFAQGRPDWRGDFAQAVAFLSTSPTLTLADDTSVVIVAIAASYRSRLEGFGDEIDYNFRLDGQTRYAITEGYMRTWLNSRFRFLPHHPTWSHSASLQLTAPRLVTVDEILYEQLVLATTFVLQGPYSSTPADDHSAEIEHGWFVGQFRALRDDFYVERPLAAQWGRFFRMSTNPDADLQAQADPDLPGQWLRHIVADVGIAESDQGVVAVACVARRAMVGDAYVDTVGTQVARLNAATGSYTLATESKASFPADDPGGVAKPLTFPLNRLAYRYVVDGEPVVVEALACVQFTSTDVVQPDSIELVLYPVIAGKLTAGLGAAGYAPFWPKLSGEYTVWGHAENLGYQVAPMHSVVQDLGSGLLGVLAAHRDALDGETIDWRLVVLRADDLTFVEDRGSVAVMDNGTTWSVLGFTVVAPETATTPAVLAAWRYTQAGINEHLFSRDGGATWHPLFTGVHGLPIYLGNQLHSVEISQGL